MKIFFHIREILCQLFKWNYVLNSYSIIYGAEVVIMDISRIIVQLLIHELENMLSYVSAIIIFVMYIINCIYRMVFICKLVKFNVKSKKMFHQETNNKAS